MILLYFKPKIYHNQTIPQMDELYHVFNCFMKIIAIKKHCIGWGKIFAVLIENLE